MGDSKALPILGGVMLVLFLPLLIVIALIVGGLAGMEASRVGLRHHARPRARRSPGRPTSTTSTQGWQDPDAEGNSHSGLDFDVDEGSKVYAAEDGEVTSIANNEVRIKHDKGVETRYKYFKDIKVKVGDKVKRGDQIGTSGSGDEATPGLTGDAPALRAVGRREGRRQPQVNTKPEDDSFGDDAASSDERRRGLLAAAT